MKKQKKFLFSIFAVVFALLIGAGVFAGIRSRLSDEPRFTVSDTLPDGEGRKATVILLGGQSNASGVAQSDYLRQKVSAEQYAEYEAGYDNVYIHYYVSGTNASEGFVKCAANQGEAGGFFGPELGMAQTLHETRPDELFFIIKCTWSGTNLYDQWLSPTSRGKTGELYRSFVRYVEASLKYLESKHYDVAIEGMCWMQGESDAFSVENATDYEVHLRNLIGDLRKKFSNYAAEGGIAFVDAYIAANPAYWVYYELVNRSKQAVADASPLNVVIDTVSHGLTCSEEPEDEPDLAHYDSLSEIKLGNLFAGELVKFFD